MGRDTVCQPTRHAAASRTDLGIEHDRIPRPHVAHNRLDLLRGVRTPRVKVEHELGVDRLRRVDRGRDDILWQAREEARHGRELLRCVQRDLRPRRIVVRREAWPLMPEGREAECVWREPRGRVARAGAVSLEDGYGRERRLGDEQDVDRDDDEDKEGKERRAIPVAFGFPRGQLGSKGSKAERGGQRRGG